MISRFVFPFLKTVALAAMIVVSPAWVAADSMSQAPSLDWQRTDLENQLTNRVTHELGINISEKLFLVSISIKLKPAPVKEKKAIEEKKEKSNSPNSATNADALDRLFLDKLGFDVPLPETEVKKEEREEVVAPPGLFESIAQIQANILVDKSIPETQIELIKKITGRILKPVSPSSPEIQVETEKAEFPTQTTDFKKMMSDLSVPLTLLVITLFLCLTFFILGYLVISNYRKIEERKMSVLEAQNTREQAVFMSSQEKESSSKDEKEDEEEAVAFAATADASHGAAHHPGMGGGGGMMGGGAEVDGVESGFDRFKSFLAENPEKALSLVRQWIRAIDTVGVPEALAVLPQVLTTNELLPLFSKITLEDRKVWKKFLSKPVDPSGYKLAEGFVSSQIVDCLLGNFAAVDDALSAKVMELSVPECLVIATENVELGGMLVNLLPASRLSGLYAIMPKELVTQVTLGSIKLQDEHMFLMAQDLDAAINKVKTSLPAASNNAFLDKAPDLLKRLSPEKESTLLDAMATSGQHQAFSDSVHQFFPSELVLKLPPKVLKAALDKFPLAKKAELISSREEAEQNLLLDTLGTKGAKSREMIDLEIQEIAGDEIRKKRIQKDSGWGDFLNMVRNLVKSNPSVAEQAERVLEEWIAVKTNGGDSSGGSAPEGSGEREAA